MCYVHNQWYDVSCATLYDISCATLYDISCATLYDISCTTLYIARPPRCFIVLLKLFFKKSFIFHKSVVIQPFMIVRYRAVFLNLCETAAR